MVTMVDSAFFLLILTGSVIRTWGQLIQVNVGIEGSFYDPGTVSAGMNDIVTFVFGGDMHDVTQSSFENPCVPLPGGFSSGLAGRGSNFSGPTPIWNLQITNVSGPLYFFCGASRPSSHCATGMVGIINPTSQDMYSSFVAAARNTSPTATVSVSYVPNGVGAFATSSPSPTANVTSAPPVTSAATTPPPSTPSATSTGEAANSGNSQSDTSHLGAIIGGSIGGAVALGGFIIILLVLRRSGSHKRKSRAAEVAPYTTENRVWDGYDRGGRGTPASPPLTGMSERSKVGGGGGDLYGTQTLGYYGQDNRGEANRYNDTLPGLNAPRSQPSSGTLQPNRKAPDTGISQPQTQIPRHPYAINRAVDQDHDEDFSSSRGGGEAHTGDVTITTLAKEVAKVLMKSPAPPSVIGETITQTEDDSEGLRGRRLAVQGSQEKLRGMNNQNSFGDLGNISRDTHSTAPPLYRSYDGRE